MNKATLIELMAKTTKLPKTACKNALEAFIGAVETSLKKLNIDKKGIQLIITNGFTQNRMNNNPRRINKKDMKKILDQSL